MGVIISFTKMWFEPIFFRFFAVFASQSEATISSFSLAANSSKKLEKKYCGSLLS